MTSSHQVGPRVLVAGVGNVFLGDDGFGVETVRRLAERDLPEHIEVLDIGVRGVHLAYQLLDGYDTLILDEAQEALGSVLTELRVLASKDLDSRQLLCVVLSGDARLVERLRSAELMPLGSRIRRRLVLDYASRDELLACLDHLLEAAGNPSLMTTELKATLADHAAGNYRVLMNLADELLAAALDRDLPRLDEKLYLETFSQPPPKKPTASKKKQPS